MGRFWFFRPFFQRLISQQLPQVLPSNFISGWIRIIWIRKIKFEFFWTMFRGWSSTPPRKGFFWRIRVYRLNRLTNFNKLGVFRIGRPKSRNMTTMGILRQLKVGENSFSDFTPKFTSKNSRKTAKKTISNHAIPTIVVIFFSLWLYQPSCKIS